jgi:ribose-phosphate pyrophosphokinase
MTSTLLLAFAGQAALAGQIASELSAPVATLDWHRFPDGESLVAVPEAVAGRNVVIVASQNQPDALALPLRFAAATAREFGARSVGLVAPYLGYMRQDHRFKAGQAISAPLFAEFLAQTVDWLVTVDPHLHRIGRLDDVYRIPTRTLSSAKLLASWIRANVPTAALIGPDAESEQWVATVAHEAGVPHQVLLKKRRGDLDVSVSLPDADALRGRVPVIVDDIVSSGRTMAETLGHLRRGGLDTPAICLVIHAVFSGDAHAHLLVSGASRVVSTDTIPHPSNAISTAGILASAVADILAERKT